MDLLNDPLASLVTFDPTAAAAAMAAAGSPGEGSGERPNAKRHRSQELDADCTSLSNFLAQLAQEEEEAAGCGMDQVAAESASKSDDDDESADAKRKGKQPLSKAAHNKACREKARRERLNEGFSELGRLVDPGAKNPKTDKASLVSDAIKVITQIRAENNQLRQLNKFLEEKVADSEKQRQQMAMQQMMMQQQQQQAAAGMMPAHPAHQTAMMAAPHYHVTGVPIGVPHGVPQVGPAIPGMGMASMGSLPSSASFGAAATGVLAGMQDMPSASSAAAMQVSFQQLPQQQQQQPAKMEGQQVSGGVPQSVPMATPSSWLPPSTLDCSQDHKLRAPAA